MASTGDSRVAVHTKYLGIHKHLGRQEHLSVHTQV
jgi:hypothetical protein